MTDAGDLPRVYWAPHASAAPTYRNRDNNAARAANRRGPRTGKDIGRLAQEASHDRTHSANHPYGRGLLRPHGAASVDVLAQARMGCPQMSGFHFPNPATDGHMRRNEPVVSHVLNLARRRCERHARRRDRFGSPVPHRPEAVYPCRHILAAGECRNPELPTQCPISYRQQSRFPTGV